MIVNALLVFFFFSLAIFVHELGHFLVARRLGLQVDVFSIGFGPALWKRKVGNVVYKFSVLPFGGYVALPQMDPSGASRNRTDGSAPLAAVAPWKKIAVAFAGVTCNVILAFVLAWIVYVMGRPAGDKDLEPVIGHVETNSLFYAAGMRSGDRIVAVNDHKVDDWEAVVFQSAMEPRAIIRATRGSESIQVNLRESSVEEAIKQFAGIAPLEPALVEMTVKGSSAEHVGLQAGDQIIALDGIQVYAPYQVFRMVQRSKGAEMQLTYRRSGRDVVVPVTPTYHKEENQVLIGIKFASVIVHPRPASQIADAATSVFKILRMLFTPKYSRRAFDALGGAPMIIFSYWQLLKAGLIFAISFSVMLNVNLAIINLLPIPVVDGGHIVLSLMEWVQGRPPQPKVVSALWQATAIVLILFMLTMTFRDFYRINKWTQEAAAEEAAAAAAVKAAP